MLAAVVRGLLQPSHPSVGHGQSLDLVAALPGLRNWPEVMAFPDRVGGAKDEESLLSRIVAIAATVDIRTSSNSTASVADLYIANGRALGTLKRFKEADEFMTAHRLVRWEDELTRLLDAGSVTHDAVKEAFPRSHGIDAFLADHAATRSGQTA